MAYLTYVWEMLAKNTGAGAVILGNMLMFFYFLRPRWKWWLYPVLLAITILAIPIALVISKASFGASIASGLVLACLGYWNDVLVLIAFRERLWKTITLIFTLCILNRLFTFIGYILQMPLNTLGGGNVDTQLSVTLVIVIMYSVISFVCWTLLRDKGRKLIQTQLSYHSFTVLAGIVVSAKLIIDFCSNYAFTLSPYSDSKIIYAMIALCVFVIAVLVLYVYNTFTTMRSLELEAAANRLTFEKEAQQRYYETQLQNQEELRRIKHDMNGHFNTLSHLLADDKKYEALQYLAELSDFAKNHQKDLYSDDPYLNAVISNYATTFAGNSVKFEHDIEFFQIELHHVEICMALSNAMQNALEASMKLVPELRYVRLQVKTKNSQLIFRITNRFDDALIIGGELPRSTKEGPGHGYGLTNIRSVAESLGGFVVCKINGDMFVLDVAM